MKNKVATPFMVGDVRLVRVYHNFTITRTDYCVYVSPRNDKWRTITGQNKL